MNLKFACLHYLHISWSVLTCDVLQGAAWVYLLLGSAGQGKLGEAADCGDRVSASSGIASGSGTGESSLAEAGHVTRW